MRYAQPLLMHRIEPGQFRQADEPNDGAAKPAATPEAAADAATPSKIRQFEQRLSGAVASEQWRRPPLVTGQGATHCKTFHAKLTGDSLNFLDAQINEWLDEHDEYEVKFVSNCVGIWTGKTAEPHLIVQVWV